MDKKLKERFRWILKNPRSHDARTRNSLDETETEQLSRSRAVSDERLTHFIQTDQITSSQNNGIMEICDSTDKRERSNLLEKITSCFGIQNEPSGSKSESDLSNLTHHCHSRRHLKIKTRKCVDRGDVHSNEKSDELMTPANIKCGLTSSCEPDDPLVCCREVASIVPTPYHQRATLNTGTTGDVAKSEELTENIYQLNRLLSIPNIAKLPIENIQRNPSDTAVSVAEQVLRAINEQPDVVLRAANEVFCASKLLSNAIDTLYRHLPKNLENDRISDLNAHTSVVHGSVSTTNYLEHPHQNLHASGDVRKQAISSVLDDISQVCDISPEVVIPCNLIPKVVQTDENLFKRVEQNILISIEDTDPIEPVSRHRSQRLSAESNRRAYLSPCDTEVSRFQVKSRFPEPTEARFLANKSVCIDTAMECDSVSQGDLQSYGPTVITSTFQPIPTEDTLLTEADEVLTTDDSESIQSIPDRDGMFDRPFSWDLVRRPTETNGGQCQSTQQTNHPQLSDRLFPFDQQPSMKHMMAGDSNALQWNRIHSTATPGGDFGPVSEGMVGQTTRTDTQEIRRINVPGSRQNLIGADLPFKMHARAVCDTAAPSVSQLHVENFACEVLMQRNNNNEKLTESVLADDGDPKIRIQDTNHLTDVPKPRDSPESRLLLLNETGLSEPEGQVAQSTSRGQNEATINASLDAFLATNQTIADVPVQSHSGAESSATAFEQDTVLDQSTQTASLTNIYDIIGNRSDTALTESHRPQNNASMPRGGGDNPRQRRRHPVDSTNRRSSRSRPGVSRGRARNNQSRNTAPASIHTEQQSPLGAVGSNLSGLVDDAYESILEQIQTLFTPHNDELGWINRWRTHVRVPGPHSGDVTVQMDTEFVVDTTITPSRRTQSTLEMRPPSSSSSNLQRGV